MLKDTIVVALFPQGLAIGLNRFDGITAPFFEALNQKSQMPWQGSLYIDDAMYMIRHQLETEESNLRVELRYFIPSTFDSESNR